MEAKEVLKILNISRATLTKYVREGIIKATSTPTGRYVYDDTCVLTVAGQNPNRINIVYAQTGKTYEDDKLEEQIKRVVKFAKDEHDEDIDKIISDKCCSMYLNRIGFRELFRLVTDRKVKNLFIENDSVLSKIDYDMIIELFRHYNCNVISMNYKDESYDSDAMLELSEFIDKYKHNFESEKYQEKMEMIAKDIKNYTK